MEQPGSDAANAVLALITDALTDAAACDTTQRLLVIGLAGAQGSGKSTLAQQVAAALTAQGVAATTLSLDDLYLTRAERLALAASEHPLLATRGVPGTHDVALGMATIAALEQGQAIALPRFDKARDDRAAPASWPMAPAGLRVLLFEGWCIGALPQTEAALAEPVNTLERDEDADGRWRHRANAALAGNYAALFARLDRLVLLAAPDFSVVARWRAEQEAGLRAAASDAATSPGLMNEAQITRFIAFYERVTRAMLTDMPLHADMVIALDHARQVRTITRQPSARWHR